MVLKIPQRIGSFSEQFYLLEPQILIIKLDREVINLVLEQQHGKI